MMYVISKATFGSYNVRDIQFNMNWDRCPYSDYATIPEALVDGILATQGYCDITLNSEGTEVVSFTARTIPSVPDECCGDNTVLSVNGVKANKDGALTLSASDVGAAPTGYGLGESASQPFNWEDVDNITRNGWYLTSGVNIDGVSGISGWCYMFVSCWNHESLTQTLHTSSPLNHCLQRSRNVDGWGPWEWVNPPMKSGIEYRTTDRRNGKAIYKRFNSGETEYREEGSSSWHHHAGFFGAARHIYLYGESGVSLTSILRDNWDNIPYTYCGVLTVQRGGNAIGGLYSKATAEAGTVVLFSYAIGGHHLAVYDISGTTWTENVL